MFWNVPHQLCFYAKGLNEWEKNELGFFVKRMRLHKTGYLKNFDACRDFLNDKREETEKFAL